MFLNALSLTTLVVTALALTMESAHVLELPQKLNSGPTMYAASMARSTAPSPPSAVRTKSAR